MTAQAIISQQLTDHQLPVFANTVVEFQAALSASVVNWKSIGQIILKDPGLVLQTLQVLKSGSKRAASREVTDMSQAAMLLGMDRVKNLITGLPVLEQTKNEDIVNGYTKAVNRAYHAACQARNWAQWKDDYAPEEVFIATFLQCIPELALWMSAPDKMYELRRRIFKNGMSPDEAQHITLGQSLQHYGRKLTAEMQLPAFLQEVLRPENARLPRVQGVLLAVQLTSYVEFGWYTEKITSLLEMIANYLNKSLSETTRIVHGTSVNTSHEAPYKNVNLPAALLALIPSNDNGLILEAFPDECDEKDADSIKLKEKPSLRAVSVVTNKKLKEEKTTGSITVENATNKPVPSKPVVTDNDSPARSSVCVSPQPALFAKAVKQLEEGVGKLKTSEIIRIAVHGMHDGAGLHRAVFAAHSKNRPFLEARFMAGTDNDPAFNNFQIKLDKLNLFSRLLEKPKSVWINDENRKKYWSLVPDDFRVFVKVNSFCAMSVHVGSKPVGLFYADRHSVDCKIDKQAFNMFRHLCLLATKCLNQQPKK